jgi:type IV pilus assembly protein PilY1
VCNGVSAELELEQTPLFTSFSSKPNLILSIDDSGSMDAETLFSTNDGALWWSTSKQSFVENGVVNDLTNRKHFYLFPNGYSSNYDGRRTLSDGSTSHFAIPPFIQYGFTRSSSFNKMYYNPNVTYKPWTSGGSKVFSNVSPTDAPADPRLNSYKVNLTKNIYSSSGNHKFETFKGMVIPKGTIYKIDGSSKKTALSDIVASSQKHTAIEYFPATYYIEKSSGSYSLGGISGNCSSPIPAHYSVFHSSPSSLIGTDSLSYDGTCLTKIEIKPSNNLYVNTLGREDCSSPMSCTYNEEIQNFANWFSYFRKRHLSLRAGTGSAFLGFNSVRTGVFTINKRNNVTMWDMSSSANVTSFYDRIYSIAGSGGTPNRSALNHAGKQFTRTDSGKPIIEACQKNFTLFFTDGFSVVENISGVGDQDGSEVEPYLDKNSDSSTLGDIAMKYYKQNLYPSLEKGKVPVPSGCEATTPIASLDCNTNLHMNTYTIGLGAKGTIFGNTHFKVQDAYDSFPSWPSMGSRDNTQIDDLYHAAVNGRGEIFNAESGDDLTNQLKQAISSIQSSSGSASAVTFNTSTLETDSALYYASFNSANWSGDLNAFGLNAQGEINQSDTDNWSAANQLNSRSAPRTILTFSGTEGIPFRWNTSLLSSELQSDLNSAPDGDGQAALNYIRGDKTKESAGIYRVRSSLLGDIVNSAPVFVGTPSLNWPSFSPFPTATGDRYIDFRTALASSPRNSVIYTGANDGMLHGFDASSGEELIAYIPNFLASSTKKEGLHYLTDPSYIHKYFVDLTPTISDVYIDTTDDSTVNPEWHSILIGGARSGGQGLFALNITDPSQFSESNASDIVLWEFTHPELGYTYSKPTITMVGNSSSSRWAAIFGNGYNDSGTGKAKLFILYLDADLSDGWTLGSDYQIISTESGSTTTPNGLASPSIVDTNADGIADRAYAGDLLGNMWAFDLSSYSVAYNTGSGSTTPKPLFIAKDSYGNIQPITSKPSISFHPAESLSGNEPNLLILFGTGKYIELSDLSDTSKQTFYGVWDNGNSLSSSLTRSNLQSQTITSGTFLSSNGTEVRLISDNTVNYKTKYGWYIDLPSNGERTVVDSQIRGDLVFFNTWLPSADACSSGGSGFLMSVNLVDGSAPDYVAFDTDGVEGLSEGDYVQGPNGTNDLQVAIGQYFNNGLPASSSFLSNYQYTPGTANTDIQKREIERLSGETGRFSWKEIW